MILTHFTKKSIVRLQKNKFFRNKRVMPKKKRTAIRRGANVICVSEKLSFLFFSSQV